MTIIKYLLSFNRYSRNGRKGNNPAGIVVHHSENPSYGAIETRNYFENLKHGKNAIYYSTHYVVGFGGEVINCVPEEEIAYHRGNNEDSGGFISITLCAEDIGAEPGINAVNSLKSLVRDIVKRYSFDVERDLLRHYDITGIKCPLYYALNESKWRQLKKEIIEETAVAAKYAQNSRKISEKVSDATGIDKKYMRKILEEKAMANIAVISSFTERII